MKISYDERFIKDLKEIKDRDLKQEIISVIVEIKEAKTTADIFELKFLNNYPKFFRVKIGRYRLGCEIAEDDIVWIIRIKHRSEIYKIFP